MLVRNISILNIASFYVLFQNFLIEEGHLIEMQMQMLKVLYVILIARILCYNEFKKEVEE